MTWQDLRFKITGKKGGRNHSESQELEGNFIDENGEWSDDYSDMDNEDWCSTLEKLADKLNAY